MDFAQLMALLGQFGGQAGAMGSPATGMAAPLPVPMGAGAMAPMPGFKEPVPLPKPSIAPPALAQAAPPASDMMKLGGPTPFVPPDTGAADFQRVLDAPAPSKPNFAALAPVLQAGMKPKEQAPRPAAPGITPGRSIDPGLFSAAGAVGGSPMRLPGVDLRARLQGLLGRGVG